ncbi:DUF3120 domain-containing protein [Synechococcus sp. A15-28]|uniref:DUF3120 domain-containing protein n=1 Tax=Synechococcus sp. A15-28 TaxID=1050638 RepID=UPI001647253A|nr:DUF3120 domain-containing protein [Synechococcus sp. A15-28]QNI43448.1 uncharacterized membrane protein (DUF3120) [Synechococcus sp. A15-28]
MIGGTWQLTAPERSWTLAVPRLAAAMVVLPVFLQAPWVRLHPFSATLFTAVLLAVGIVLEQSGERQKAEIGQLLVGFSGSWLAGCLFWGWLRAHPLLHLPVEAFALPLALTGLSTRWRLASAFYLASLLGTAVTDLIMAMTGVMQAWPAVVMAPIDLAPGLLHQAGLELLHPLPLLLLAAAAILILSLGRRCHQQGSTWSMAGAVLITTVWVDGLFLATALLQPGLSGLIE